MTTGFPTSLDTADHPAAATATTAGTGLGGTAGHHGEHSDANDAIVALETKVGVDSSTVTSTIDWIIKTKPYNVVVFKSGATTYAVRYDGVVIDSGSNSKNVINSGIDNIAATADVTGGGTVFIRAGLYNITGKIVMKSGVVLMGEGHSGRDGQASYNSFGTILKSNTAGLAAVIDAPFNTATFAQESIGAQVRDLVIDGNSGQADAGITSAVRDFSLNNVTIRDCDIGWDVQTSTQDQAQRAIHCNIWNCITGIQAAPTDGSIVDCRILGCSSRGAKITGGGWIVQGCHFTNGGSASEVDLECTGSSPNSIITGNYFDTCGNENIIISGVWHTIVGNFLKAGSGNTTQMVKVTTAGGKGTISGNFFNPDASTVNWVKYTSAATAAGRVCTSNSGTNPTGALIANSAGTELEPTDDANQYIKGNRGFT